MNFDGTDAEIAKREQQATDSAFLNELCKDYGLILKVYSNELWIYDREAFKKKAVAATITRADIVPGSFSFSDGFDGVYTHGIWEYSNQKKKIRIRVEIGTGGRTKRISKYASSQADAERRLQAALDNANHSATKVKFTLALAQIELGEAQNIRCVRDPRFQDAERQQLGHHQVGQRCRAGCKLLVCRRHQENHS